MQPWLSRSWLFEIVDTTTEVIERSFTLVLPPQSYSIKEKARVTVTKTFGNAFIDDYGADNLEITIKGISGTSHVFPTFRTSGVSTGQPLGELSTRILGTVQNTARTGYDARGAFYAFRDDIMRYRDRENFDRKELRVYDLYDEQAYKCVLLQFDLDRSSAQPLHYPFTISLLVYARMDSKKASQPKKIAIGKTPLQALDKLDEAFQWLHDAAATVKSVQNQIATAQGLVNTIRLKLKSYYGEAASIIESPLKITKQLIDATVLAGGFLYDAYSQGKLTYYKWASMREMMQQSILNGLALYGFAIEEGSQQSKRVDVPSDNGVVIDSETSVVDRDATIKSFTFTGLNKYTVKANDSLQSIALQEMGDETLWPYIAAANNIEDNSGLQQGEEIFIPVNTDVEVNKDNFIMSEDTARDPYGSDIKVDSDGNLVLTESNDFLLVSNIANVQQAVDLRLGTVVGSMIKQTAYGLMGQPGIAGTTLAFSYIRMGIKSALMKDPRIESISDLNVRVEKDVITASMNISVVGADKTLPVSVLI